MAAAVVIAGSFLLAVIVLALVIEAGIGVGATDFERLSRLDPDRFTSQDISEVFGCRFWVADALCRVAVRRGDFVGFVEGGEQFYRYNG